MFSSVEVRWFYPGKVPTQVQRWFDQDNKLDPLPERTDFYLRYTGGSLGVKLRQGYIELKQNTQHYGPVRFHQSVQGQVEGWQKWSIPVVEESGIVDSVRGNTAWLGVLKQRCLRMFALNRKIKEISPDVYPELGCSWEITKVSLSDRSDIWWTVAYEAFGESQNLKDLLFDVIAHTINSTQLSLQIESSSGYPAWIQGLDK